MNKRIYKNSLFLFFVMLLVNTMGVSQILHPTTGTETVTLNCGDTDVYYDDGGAAGNYTSSNTSTLMICAPDPSCAVTVTFTEFDVEASDFGSCWDELTISGDINGNNGTFAGDDSDAGTGLSCMDATDAAGNPTIPTLQSAYGGCLTFAFDSDSSISQSGWAADVATVDAPGDPGDPGDGGPCALVCEGPQEIQLAAGECSIPVPVLYTMTGDCSPFAPEPQSIDGFVDELAFSSYTDYGIDATGLTANLPASEPFIFNNDGGDYSDEPNSVFPDPPRPPLAPCKEKGSKLA